MHSQNKCRQFTIWQMVLYPDPAHLCLRGWYSSLGGKSVYIYYATEAQPILFFSNRCDSSRGLLVFLAEKKKCQTITLSNKWSKKNAFDYGVQVGSFFTRRGCVSVNGRWFTKLPVVGWSLFHGWKQGFRSDSSCWDLLEVCT